MKTPPGFLSMLSILFFSTFNSCTNKRNNSDEKALELLQGRVFRSTELLNKSTKFTYTQLENSWFDWCKKDQAAIWTQNLNKILFFKRDIYFFEGLGSFQNPVQPEQLNKLFQTLLSYRDSVLNVDTNVKKEFIDKFGYIEEFAQFLGGNLEHYPQPFSKRVDKKNFDIAFNVLGNSISALENAIAEFCYSQVICMTFIVETFSVIVNQNMRVIGPGEEIEITAGVGSFTVRNKPEFSVNNHKLRTNEEGFIVNKVKAPNKPGNYRIPVKVDYTDQDGKRQSIQKHVNFKVVEPCPGPNSKPEVSN